MIINVSAFTDAEARQAMNRAADVRIEALKMAYSIDGYKAAPLAVKNWIYDQIIRRIERMA